MRQAEDQPEGMPEGPRSRAARGLNRLLLALIRGYRYALGPWLGGACRFHPSCSRYAEEALRRFGPARGLLLAGWRLLRCQPLCAGGEDPVPERWPWRRLAGHRPLPPRQAA